MTPKTAPSPAATAQSLLHLPLAAALMAIVMALQPVIVTYDGWYGAIYFAEEDKEPGRNLPRSSMLGSWPAERSSCWSMRRCFTCFRSKAGGFADAGRGCGGTRSWEPRQECHSPSFAAHRREHDQCFTHDLASNSVRPGARRPDAGLGHADQRGRHSQGALLVSTAASIGLVLSGGFETLVEMASILFVAVYMSGFVSLFDPEIKEAGLPRPFRMWGYPWTNLAICLGTGAFLVAAVIADLKHALFTLVVVVHSPVRFTYPLRESNGRDAIPVGIDPRRRARAGRERSPSGNRRNFPARRTARRGADRPMYT